MQTIRIGKKLANLKTFKKRKILEMNLPEEIIKEIKQSEEEFERGLEIPAEEVFKELREKYGF